MDHSSAAQRVRSLYDDGGDPGFAAVLDFLRPTSDRDLATVIEVDGRLRLALGRDVALDRYLDTTSLQNRPIALDAAIDVALRAVSRSSLAGEREVEALVRNYPHLEQSIREAAILGQALRSTTSIQVYFSEKAPLRELPLELGPKLADGRARYELREVVGEGATGTVYRAVDRHLSDDGASATVAIKLFSPPKDEAFGRWLREEALKARRVNHENVVRALDRGDTPDGESYIVYEFISGGDLGEWIRRCGVPMPVLDAARLVAEVARGVQAIHTAGLVHCDLKPGNIAMTEDGKPKVADFGIAMRQGQPPSVELSPAGTPVGSFAFISPEQFNGSPGAYSFPSDIYSLGAMLAFLVTGSLPNGATAREIRARHAAPRPVTLEGKCDPDLRRIVERATAVDPSDRYASAQQFAEDLDRFVDRRPLAWGRTRPLRRTTLFIRRRPVLAAVGALAALAVATAITVKVREDLRRNQAIALLHAYLIHFAEGDQGGENLAFLTMWEQFAQGAYFDSASLAVDVNQIDILRRLHKSGRSDSSDSLVVGSTLAFALATRESDYIEAGPLASECRKEWQQRFGANDPMALRMAVVEAAAEVNGLLAAYEEGATLEPQTVAHARAALQEAGARLPAQDEKGPVYKLYQLQLQRLQHLDRSASAVAAADRWPAPVR